MFGSNCGMPEIWRVPAQFFYLFSSTSYLNQGKIEKAIAEAREAYALSLPITDPAAERFAADLLNTCYEKSGNLDSAYYYLKLKDSLNDVDPGT